MIEASQHSCFALELITRLLKQLGAASLAGYGCEDLTLAIGACGGCRRCTGIRSRAAPLRGDVLRRDDRTNTVTVAALIDMTIEEGRDRHPRHGGLGIRARGRGASPGPGRRRGLV